MKKLIKNIALGIGIYIGWNFLEGVQHRRLDLVLGERDNEKLINFGEKIVSKITGEEETNIDEKFFGDNNDTEFVDESEKSEE